jgi:hypothetical protein
MLHSFCNRFEIALKSLWKSRRNKLHHTAIMHSHTVLVAVTTNQITTGSFRSEAHESGAARESAIDDNG